MINLGHVVGVPDYEGEDLLRAAEVHLHPLRALAQEDNALVGCVFVTVGKLSQVVGGDIPVAASDFDFGVRCDVFQAGRDHHLRAGLVRQGLYIGAELQVFGCALEGGNGQLENQWHQVPDRAGGLALGGLQRAGERDEIRARLAVLGDAGQGVHHAILAHGNGVDVEGALAVLVEDGAVVGVLAGLDVVGDQVQVFEALGFAHRRLGLAGQALAVDVDGTASQVMDGLAVRAEGEAEVAVAELVEHAAELGRLGGDAVEHLGARHARVEPEQVARVAMHAVDHLVTRAPEGLAPIVAHVARVSRVVQAEVILLHVLPLDGRDGVLGGVTAKDGAFGGGEVSRAVLLVHRDGAADGAVIRADPVFAEGAHLAKALLVFSRQVVAVEDAAGPGDGKQPPALLVHVEREHALAARADAEVLELAGLEVVGEQVAARVASVAGGRDAHGFLALDDAIDADVRGEVELAVGLDEVDVALALGNGLAALFLASLGEISEFFDLLGLRVEAEHLGALVDVVRAEHVVNLPVAAGAHRVVAVVAEGEAGVVGLGDDLLALVSIAVWDY